MGCIHSKAGHSPTPLVPRTSEEILRSIDSSVPRFLVNGDRLSVDEDLADDLGSPMRCTSQDSDGFALLRPNLLSSALPRSVKETFQLKVGVLEGTTFLNDYVVVDTLGRGSHGKVKLCLNVVDNHLYAVKIVETVALSKQAKSRLGKRSMVGGNKQSTMSSSQGELNVDLSRSSESTIYSQEASLPLPKSSLQADSLLGSPASKLETSSSSHKNLHTLEMEADVMKALNHPNLVRLYEVIRSDNSGKLLMVMEYCHAGPLVDERGRFSHCQDDIPEIIVHHFFKQITSAVQYLHAEGIVHGDIKPDNMLLSGDGTVKISDFGQSLKVFDEEGRASGRKTSMLTKTLGTPAYLAPEICAGEEYDGFAADIWALGVTLYSFMFGKLPFEGATVVDLYDTIAEKEVEFPEGRGLSIELQDLFLRLLHKNPKFRITANELVMHPWVTTNTTELDAVEQMFEDDCYLPPEFRVVQGGSPPTGASPSDSTLKPQNYMSPSDDDGCDGEIEPDMDADGPSSSRAATGTTTTPGHSRRALPDSRDREDDSFGVRILRSLSLIASEGKGQALEAPGTVPGSRASTVTHGHPASSRTSLQGSSRLSSAVTTTLEEFNSIADQLLKSQRSMLDRRMSRSQTATANHSSVTGMSLVSIQESGSMEFNHKDLGGTDASSLEQVNLLTGNAGTSSARPALTSPFDVTPASQANVTNANNTAQPAAAHSHHSSVVESVEDALHTADETTGAALMYFEAGEFIDGFGHDDQHYAYYIDTGEVDIRYMADLPVSFDNIVGNCLEDAIASHYSTGLMQADSVDLTNADSVCYTENPSNFVFKHPSRNKASPRFPSFPSLHTLQGMVERILDSGGGGGSTGEDVSAEAAAHRKDDASASINDPYKDNSVHRFVEQSERAMSLASRGHLGDLLTATRSKGQFIGALGLLDPEYFQNKWKFSAIAITDISVIKMNKEALQKFLIVHPLSQVSLRASMSCTVSELVKLEMYERISLARRRPWDTFAKPQTSSSSMLAAANQGFEEVAKHLTERALASAEVLAKLDLFALVSRLRDDAQATLSFRKKVVKRQDDAGDDTGIFFEI